MSPTTFVYKTVGTCEIKADVLQPSSSPPRPAVMWIHGGALISGSRKFKNDPFHNELLKRGHVIISIDYRLAPQAKLPAIVEDIQDAWQWLREQGPTLFNIDPNRLAVAGGSAGGYLTLTCGHCLAPRPRALVSYFGYGDITSPWFTRPDDFYRQQPLISKEDAYRSIGEELRSEPPTPDERGKFYKYARQNGIWPNEVSGQDPKTNDKAFDPYCPIRYVTNKYPPTLLIHGTADTDVPYAESKNMANKLAEQNVEHELITVEGWGHGFEGEKADELAVRAAEFIDEHLR